MYFSNFTKQFLSILITFCLLSSQITLAVENIQTPLPNNPSNLPTSNPNNLSTPPIIIDTSVVSNNPTLDKARNNIDIVNIAAPNDAGISSNYYKEFNVSKSGVIFNNSKDLITSTELAGFINGNIHLNDKEASLILNQVTGNNISELLGFMEIAGKGADLILANPNGITCDGCGFINSSSSTLTTGRISLEEINRLNDLKDLNAHLNVMVTRGHINIEALNSSNIPTLNLIAKSLFVNKNLLANKLNIILGTNKVDIDISKNASILLYEPIEIPNDINESDSNDINTYSSSNDPNEQDKNKNDKEDKATSKTKTALALDVAYLGSTLAHSIYLVATEKGIGVKNSGRIATLASEKEGDGGFIINVNGKVEIAKPKEGNTIDTPTDTFIPPSILSSSDLIINAKEVENHSIISAKGNVEINAESVNNIGSLELEKVEVKRESHSSWCEDEGRGTRDCGSKEKHTIYEYDKIITEDHLKENTYDPAIITAKNIHIKATNFKNDSAILYSDGKLDIKAMNIINTQPIPKRVEKKVGTKRDYDRKGGYCGSRMFGFGKHNWNCHSKWYDPFPYTPAPTISSIHLSLPSVDLENLISNTEDTNRQTLSNAIFDYKIETNPLYTSKDNFISTDDFKSFLHNEFIITHPLADIRGIIDGINKNTQDFINHNLSSNRYSNLAILNSSKNPNNINDALALNNTDDSNILAIDDSSTLASSSDETNTSASTESLAYLDSNSTSSTQANLTPYQKAQIKALGVYGKDIALISTDAKNSSNIKGNHIAINAKFLLNKNGEIVANNPDTLSPTDNPTKTNVATNTLATTTANTPSNSNNTGNLAISGEVFKNISSTLEAKNIYLNSDSTEIISGTNSTEGSYSVPTVSNTIGFGMFSFKKEPSYASSKTSLDALSSINTDNLYIKGEKVAIKGGDINATHHINISATTLDISTVKLSDDYADKTQSHSNTTHLTSSLKGEDISINVAKDANLTSTNLQAKNDINLNAGGNINFNSDANSFMSSVSTTEYSEENLGLSSTTTTTTTTTASSTHLANSIAANNVHINSNSSINANNLAINAKGEASINAKDNITLSNLADTYSHSQQTHQETKGLSFSSEGDNYSMSFGKDSADISDKTSASLHHKQAIQASSISMNAGNKATIESSNLIAHNGDISISASDVSISSLKDEFTHQKDETYTSNRVGISVPKSYAGELGKAAGKSTLNGLGKGLQWIGDHLDPNNPNNVIVSNHKGLYSIPGKWLSQGADKIKSPSLSQIDHLEVGIGFTHTDKNTHHLSSNSHNSSSDLIANNISINAKNKADIIGSNLNAQNDINLAAKNLHITSSSDEATSSTTSASNNFSASLSANIGKDTSMSAKASYEHSKNEDFTHQITQASSNLSSKNLHINTSEDTLIEGSSINAKEESAIKAKSFTLTSKENTLSTKHTNSSAGGSMKISYNGSFGGEGNGHYNKSDTNTQSLTHTASSLNTGNLSIVTDETSSIIGSSINAKDATIKSKSVNILAAKDAFSSNSKSDSYSGSMGVNFSNLSSSKLEGNTHHTSNEKDDSTYNNASLNIDNLGITTQKDLNIKGGNIVANNLQANIKGDMNIESLQDRHTEKHKDFSIGASLDNSHFKPSFENYPTNSSTSVVKTQSGINTKNSLQVNVEGNTALKGAYINVDSKQNPQAPSTFTTHSLSSSDMINSSHIKVNRGIKGDKEEKNISKTSASISANINLKQDTHTKVTRSTPSNETLKELTLPKKEDNNNKSLFNTLVEFKDIGEKAFDLGLKTKATFKREQSPKGFKEIAKQTFKDTDKGIDLAYSDGKPIVSSLGELIGDEESKKIANDINGYISLTHNTKEMSKEIVKGFDQSFKENVTGVYHFIKPLGDSLLDVGWKNTSDVLGSLVGNEDGKSPKDTWKSAEKQGNEAVNAFTHKVLWE